MLTTRPSVASPVWASQQAKMSCWPGVRGGKYHLVDTLPKWKELHAQMIEQVFVACDLECNSLAYLTGKIVGFSFSWGAENSFYVPIRHTQLVQDPSVAPEDWNPKKPKWVDAPSDEKQLKLEQIWDDLQQFYSDPDITTIWHNGKFDIHFLRMEGFTLMGIVHDTRLMHSLLDENSSAALKDIANILIDRNANQWEKMVDDWRAKYARAHKMPKKDVHYGLIPLEIMTPYASSDAHYTLLVYKDHLPQIANNESLRNLYVQVEAKLLWTLLDMEHDGVVINRDYLGEAGPEMQTEMERLGALVKEKLGSETVNINSNIQVIPILQKLGVRLWKKTKTGRPSLDAEVLESLGAKYDVCRDLMNYRKLDKKLGTYVNSILEKTTADQKLHCEYNQNVTTGRMCLAEGTLVQMPCDRSKDPKGIPIEKVKAGDWVYSYDTDGNLQLKRVKWAGCTGRKPVVKLSWQGSGHKSQGDLLLTADHPVMTADGFWAEAGKLLPGERLMALSVGNKLEGYPYLYARYGREIREHRFIYESLFGNAEVVHHRDGNKENNLISNLEATTASEHSAAHMAAIPLKEKQARAAAAFHTPDSKRKARDARPKGTNHFNWKNIPRATLLRWAAICAGKIRKIMNLTGMDHTVLKRKYELAEIDLKEIRKRYGSNDQYVSPSRLAAALTLPQPDSYQSLNLHFYKFKELCQFYGMANNHEVLSVTPAGEALVFDLEVENTHAFIANEICVHNSAKKPNTMNIPRGDVAIRRAFVAPERFECMHCSFVDDYAHSPTACPSCGSSQFTVDNGYFLCFIDLSQIEVRLTAHFSEDPILLDVYCNTGEDVHLRTCCEMFSLNYSECEKILADKKHKGRDGIKKKRQIAKMINFLIIYGGGAKNLAAKISTPEEPYTEADCKVFIKRYFEKYKGVQKWINRTKLLCREQLGLQNHFGRWRRLPELKDANRRIMIKSEKWKIERAQRQGVNFMIQGTAADLFKIALVRVHDMLKGKKTRMVMPIHDEIVFYYHRSEMAMLPDIKHEMEDFHFRVPIIAEVAYSQTNWADKKELSISA